MESIITQPDTDFKRRANRSDKEGRTALEGKPKTRRPGEGGRRSTGLCRRSLSIVDPFRFTDRKKDAIRGAASRRRALNAL